MAVGSHGAVPAPVPGHGTARAANAATPSFCAAALACRTAATPPASWHAASSRHTSVNAPTSACSDSASLTANADPWSSSTSRHASRAAASGASGPLLRAPADASRRQSTRAASAPDEAAARNPSRCVMPEDGRPWE